MTPPTDVSSYQNESGHSKRTHSGAKELFRPFLASWLPAHRYAPSAILDFRSSDAPVPTGARNLFPAFIGHTNQLPGLPCRSEERGLHASAVALHTANF